VFNFLMRQINKRNMVCSTKFWVEDPCVLFTDLVFFPTADMTREEKLNALTRLAFIIAVVMYFMEYKHWLVFLLIAVLFLVVVQYAAKARENGDSADASKKTSLEHFSFPETRVTEDQHTVVAPTFVEEHRIPPPAYDIYTNVEFAEPAFEEPIRPQAYPYGQYLTRTNLLPSDEYYLNMNPTGGARTAREFANDAFLRHRIGFQENLMRVYKKRLNRRFRHNSQDTFSPFHSY